MLPDIHLADPVHYVDAEGVEHAAVVVKKHTDTTVNLQVFQDSDQRALRYQAHVRFDAQMGADSWHGVDQVHPERTRG